MKRNTRFLKLPEWLKIPKNLHKKTMQKVGKTVKIIIEVMYSNTYIQTQNITHG